MTKTDTLAGIAMCEHENNIRKEQYKRNHDGVNIDFSNPF